jgi:transcriptional regulator with XRE-family HTH domain
MTLGDRVQLWRAKKGWGLRELARNSGVDVSLISRLESGDRQTISLDAAMKLARALGISLDYLSGMYEEQESMPTSAALVGA